ncbi:MAG: hypothetical protein ACTSVV_18380, partial [Promethearchaeota archaeon]
LIQYFPYIKINPFKRKQLQFEKKYLINSEIFNIQVFKIDNHNNSIFVINKFKPDLIIVFGARPLEFKFLLQLNCPIINHHGAILPYFRGLDADP